MGLTPGVALSPVGGTDEWPGPCLERRICDGAASGKRNRQSAEG